MPNSTISSPAPPRIDPPVSGTVGNPDSPCPGGGRSDHGSVGGLGQFQDAGFGVRRFGAWNWLGMWTLYLKEVRRFWKVAFQTVFAPVITTILYLIVFMGAWGATGRGITLEGQAVSFFAFLPPGLIMMSILNNAFQNASSSLVISKVQGNLVDVLMPPLSAMELTIAYVAGAATRGLLVGLVTAVTVAIFVAFSSPLQIYNIWAIIYFALSASIFLGALGAITGMWADKFDQMALIVNFLITPLTFLSGTFYSIRSPWLPEFVLWFSYANPLFYMIDGFRYGFIGVSDSSPIWGACIVFILNIMACGTTYILFRTGYKLRS